MIDVNKAKQKILELALQGRLTKQLESDGDAKDLLSQIIKEKQNALANNKNVVASYASLNIIDNFETPFEIPKNWVWCRLGDIGKWGAGATPLTSKTEYYASGTIPWILTGDLNDSYIDKAKHFITNKALDECSLELRKKGSVLIAMYGATIGKLAILNIDATMNQACCACTAYEGVNNRYLFYYLLYYKKIFISKGSGGAQPNISKDKIIKTEFSLPPAKEQKRIVDIVEKLYEKLDKIDEAQKKYQKDKEILKSKIIEAGIKGQLTKQLKSDGNAKDLLDEIIKDKEKKVGKKVEIKEIDESEQLFEIPKSWVWCRLGDIGKWGAGTTPLTSNCEYYENGTIPWILTGDLNDDYINRAKHYITNKALDECSLELREKGSVLIAMYGATIGKLAILNIDATMNQACCACTTYVGVSNKYLFNYLLYYKKLFVSKGSGGAQSNISKEKIVRTEFPLPPLAEQERIVKRIEELSIILNN